MLHCVTEPTFLQEPSYHLPLSICQYAWHDNKYWYIDSMHVDYAVKNTMNIPWKMNEPQSFWFQANGQKLVLI